MTGQRQRSGLGMAAVLLLLIGACAPVVRAPGPALTQPILVDGGILAADGTFLPLHVWMPPGADEDAQPKAVIVALHGFNDYGNFFEAPGAFLAERGIASYAIDQRGFGRAPVRGVWPGAGAMVDDLKLAAALIAGRHPGVALYLLGESMGGAVIMAAMAGKDAPTASGVILAAPAVWGRETMPFYQRAALEVSVRVVPWLTVTGQGLGIKASDNIEMLRALGRDPLVIKETRIDTLYGMVGLMDAALAAAPAFDARSLILYGRKDEVIPDAPTRLMLSRLPADGRARRTVALYDGGFHMLLRDLQAETVWRDIAAWIEAPGRPLPSGADRRVEKRTAGE